MKPLSRLATTISIWLAATAMVGCEAEDSAEEVCVLNQGQADEVEGVCCNLSSGADGVCVSGMCTNGQLSEANDTCGDGRRPRMLADSGTAGGQGGGFGGAAGGAGGQAGAGGQGGAAGGVGGAGGQAGAGGAGGQAGAGGAVGGAGGQAGAGGAGGQAGAGGAGGQGGQGGQAGAGGQGGAGGQAPGAAIGDACADAAQCLGGPNDICIPETEDGEATGFTGGYCTRLNCAGADPCPAGSECIQIDNAGTTACFDLCDGADPCRGGYECTDLGGASACLPPQDPGPDPQPEGVVGASCMDDAGCGPNGTCIPESEGGEDTGFVGGYCIIFDCANNPCPAGSECFQIDDAGTTACFDLCDGADPCRDGYECVAELNACLPAEDPGPDPDPDPEPGIVGGPCVEDADCGEGDTDVCIPESDEDGDTGFVGGYCLQVGCSDFDPCPGGSECFQVTEDGATACLDLCDDADPCRDGYVCDAAGDLSVCVPPADEPDPDPDPGPAPAAGEIGAACADDADCGEGDINDLCVPAEDEDGVATGWDGGYCTAGCDAFLDCPAGSTCLAVDEQGTAFCFDDCASSNECREGYACFPDLNTCLPVCRNDLDCAEGDVCNLETGLCDPAQ